jgi:hypothetical protein
MDGVATGLWPVGLGREFTDKRPTGPWLQLRRSCAGSSRVFHEQLRIFAVQAHPIN